MAAGEEYPYRRIVAELREQILSGGLAPAERMPSETELAATYRTSRPTVRRALAVLRGEGLITTGQGSGTFVRARPGIQIRVTGSNYRRHRALGLPGFNAQVLAQGRSPGQDITEVARIDAPSHVAQNLRLDQGAPVVVRRRVFLADDVPVALTDSYYPAALAAGTAIEKPEPVKGGVHAIIEDEDGPIRRKVARSEDDITARMPTPGEARLLQLPPGVPVFHTVRTIYDAEGQPLEVQDTIAAADRNRFRYEVDMR
jgi:GntR family transcriptional regulator